jgi:hypothetical protein
MKTIPLTQGKVAIVDDEDFELLNQWKWNAYKNNNTFYARRRIPGTNKKITMHRQIADAPAGVLVDHKNGNGLDNQRSNLRKASKQQNGMNRRIGKNNKSGIVGVRIAPSNKWMSDIRIDGKLIHLGSFKKKSQAVKARKQAEERMFGEYSRSAP